MRYRPLPLINYLRKKAKRFKRPLKSWGAVAAFVSYYSVSQKKIPPEIFWHFFPNGWEFFVQILHTCYMFLSTLDYKFLFN